jgi:N-acetylglucosamine-6-phosphate deacetylase
VTLAPEVAGADALLAALAERGVVAALGHTRASAEEIDASVARGLRHVTHLWNAMGPLHHREPGVPGAVLGDDRLSADLICDGHHVHPSVVRTTARALGERMMLITDRVAQPERGAVASALGDASPDGEEGPWRRADGTLVGSSLGLDGAVRNLVRFAEVGLAAAVAACTSRPAALRGVEAERGTLRVGARAAFAALDADGRVIETWLDGAPAWAADRDAAH